MSPESDLRPGHRGLILPPDEQLRRHQAGLHQGWSQERIERSEAKSSPGENLRSRTARHLAIETSEIGHRIKPFPSPRVQVLAGAKSRKPADRVQGKDQERERERKISTTGCGTSTTVSKRGGDAAESSQAAGGSSTRPSSRTRRQGSSVEKACNERERERTADELGGMWRPIPELSMEEIGLLDKVVIEGKYWEAPCIVAGVVNGLNFRGGDKKLRVLVTGTQTESLLKAVGGRCQEMEVHLCSQPCESQVWNNSLVHVERLKVQSEPVEAWCTNLEDARGRGLAAVEEPEAGDQLVKLRKEMKKVIEGVNMEEYSPEGGAAPVVEGDKERSKAKKKVKKKEKEKVRPCLEVPLKDIFARTGVDPDPQMRRSLMRKARKIRRGKKKKKKGSQSRSREKEDQDSDTSTTSSSQERT